MRTLEVIDPRRRAEAERDLGRVLRTLFRRLRGLASFRVADAASVAAPSDADRLLGDLYLLDITVFPGFRADCFGEIAVVLVDLIDERPEARELVRGRTFARSRSASPATPSARAGSSGRTSPASPSAGAMSGSRAGCRSRRRSCRPTQTQRRC